MKQYRMDYHVHTLHSMDGRQSMDELCQSMLVRGVDECCITEHIEPGHPDCDIPPVWDVWLREIHEMRQKYRGKAILLRFLSARDGKASG